MLDVTANNIANVNTIGYKASRDDVQGLAAADFSRRRGLRPAHGRPERGRRSASASARLDRQPHDRWRAAVHGQPARRRHPGRGLVPRRRRRRRRQTRPTPTSTPARATSPATTRATSSPRTGYYVEGRPAAPTTRPRAEDQVPAGASGVTVGPTARFLHPAAARDPHVGRPDLTGQVRQRERPRARLGQPLAGGPELGHARPSASPAPTSARPSAAPSRSRTSTSPTSSRR